MWESMSGYGMHPASLSALFLQNPEAAKALRQQQFAQFLLNGSKPEDIKSPAQGLNHLARSALAAYLMNRGDAGFDAAAEAQKSEADQARAQFQRLLDGGGGGGGGVGVARPMMPPVDVPPGIHQTESNGSMQPGIYGDNGRAAGPMQVHPQALSDVNERLGTNYTHAQLAAKPEIGKMVGDTYYAMNLQRFGGDDAKARAAYNAGPGRVAAAVAQYGDNWLQGIPESTRAYLQRTAPTQAAPGAAPPPGQSVAPAAQPQAAPWAEKEARSQQFMAWASANAGSPNAVIRHNAAQAREMGMMLARQAETERNTYEARVARQEDRAETRRLQAENRVPGTVTMQDPDGKGVGIYERTPTGVGQRIGNAPKQPGEGAFAGTGMDQQAANALLEIGPKIKDGTATPAERAKYELAYGHYEQGDLKMVPDPQDPTGQRQVMARVPRPVPDAFPRPDGAAAGAPSGGAGPSVIPGTTKPAPALTESQGRIATFADRIAATLPIIEDTTAAGLNPTQQTLRGVPLIGNYLISNDTQKLDQAQRNFINAVLRRESGAVITAEEFANAEKQYFPKPGDRPDVLEQKRKNRQDVLEGFAREAGPQYKMPSLPSGGTLKYNPATGRIE